MNHNTAAIRKLLTAAFTDEDLTAFCFDHFREVYYKFGRGLTHSEKVQLLLEYCETNQGLQHATDTLRADEVPHTQGGPSGPTLGYAQGRRPP